MARGTNISRAARPIDFGKGVLIGALCSFLLGMITLGREYALFTIMPLFLTVLLAVAIFRRGYKWIALGIIAGTVAESVIRIFQFTMTAL